jgi:hypothetical protein
MIVVLVGEAGAAALEGLGEATEIHAIGFVPVSQRPVAVHTRHERDVACDVAADVVIGGDPEVWGLSVADPEPTATDDYVVPDLEPAPKRRGRPPGSKTKKVAE